MEHAEQATFVEWFRRQYPRYRSAIRISLNGVRLPYGARSWSKCIALGAVAGESDIVVAVPRGGYGCLVIEHKGQGKARKVTDDQRAYINDHLEYGNYATSTRGVDELIEVVKKYMEGRICKGRVVAENQ